MSIIFKFNKILVVLYIDIWITWNESGNKSPQ